MARNMEKCRDNNDRGTSVKTHARRRGKEEANRNQKRDRQTNKIPPTVHSLGVVMDQEWFCMAEFLPGDLTCENKEKYILTV